MRRRLILMRHAKSSWKSDAPTDHARPLNKRGRRASPAVARHLHTIGWVPESILLSDSQRTTSTAELMCEVFDSPPPCTSLRSLYHGGVREIADALRDVDHGLGTVLVLGHNPGWEMALSYFSGADHVLKTADAALLEAENEAWGPLVDAAAQFQLIAVVRSRDLDTAGAIV